MEFDNVIVTVPEYLDKPLNDEEEKEFFSDIDLNSQENLITQDNSEEEKEELSKEDYQKLYDAYMYEKSLNEYNALTEEQYAKYDNYLNQISNIALVTCGFVGMFVVFYLLAIIVKFFKSLFDF